MGVITSLSETPSSKDKRGDIGETLNVSFMWFIRKIIVLGLQKQKLAEIWDIEVIKRGGKE